ncbi:MAG: acyl-CoA dehydrogenase family protein [Candidatus Methanospirareceae archaeon]
MDFEFTEEQKMIMRVAREIAEDFPPEYWREKEEKKEFGEEFWRAISEAGFVGIVIPEEHGGAGMGLTELIIAMEELAANGCGMAGAWYLILTEIFGAISILRHGTEEQKERYLPRIARGECEFCMAVTEADAGSNTLDIRTTARREGDEWVINGRKMFISGVDRARGMLIVARTTPKEEVERKTYGISLFLADLPNEAIEISHIEKHGINYSKTFEVTFNDLRLPKEALMPPLDRGWYSLLDTLNSERISFSAAAIGVAKLAIKKAVEYSKRRKVFDDEPIGSYQGLQFPLAETYANLEAARLLNLKAAWLFDKKAGYREIGAVTNMAKAVAVKNSIKAVYWAMQTFGGYGYAREYDVERWWREVNLLRLAPLTEQMALNYIAEHVLGMPRGYGRGDTRGGK